MIHVRDRLCQHAVICLSLGKVVEVTIIEKFDSSGTFNHFSNTVTEAVVAENAGIGSVQHSK